MPVYPETPLDRAVDSAIARENRRALGHDVPPEPCFVQGCEKPAAMVGFCAGHIDPFNPGDRVRVEHEGLGTLIGPEEGGDGLLVRIDADGVIVAAAQAQVLHEWKESGS